MPELITILSLPPYIRHLYGIPQLHFYFLEKTIPVKLLKKDFTKCRILCKCLRYGFTDPEAQVLMERLPHAKCLADYESWTTRLDVIQDHESWKESKESPEPEYDPNTIQRHIMLLYDALDSQDHDQIRIALKSAVFRTLGGMDMTRLYKHCWFGTKRLIDDYVHAVRGTIEAYVDILTDPYMPASEVRKGIEALGEYLELHGQAALCLSGGAIFGMKHIGVVKCLWESFLLPRIICGVSAGSVIAAIVGTATDDEMQEILARFPRSRLECFYAAGTSVPKWIFDRVWTLCNKRVMYDPKCLTEVMYDWIGDITFLEAYYKTGRILNIGVSKPNNSDPTVLNYKTAPDVVVRTAVCASCAVPYVFPPARIYEKDKVSKQFRPWNGDEQQKYVDGSLDNDIPTAMLRKDWNANYFIVSQVNPHVRWFLSPQEEFAGVPITTPHYYEGILHGLKALAHKALTKAVEMGKAHPLLGSLPFWRPSSLITQPYEGDVNIRPSIHLWDYPRLILNPTPEIMRRSTRLGEQATWPTMPRIKNCLAIEEALRKGIKDLNERLSLGPRPERRQRGEDGEQPTSRSASPHPEFLKRRSFSASGPALRRSSSDDGWSRSAEAVQIRRNRSVPDLISTLDMSRTRPSSSSPPPLLSPQIGVRGTLYMTPIDQPPNATEEN